MCVENPNSPRTIYALNVSPGHHTTRSSYGGFCFVNNAAVAVERFIELGYNRVVVLDLDYHHGNGTQEIYYMRSNVLTISIHGNPVYEYPTFSGFEHEVGEGEGIGYNINIPLPLGTNLTQYLETLDKIFEKIIEFNCDAVVIPFGGDTYKDDPESSPFAKFGLEVEDYILIGKKVNDFFKGKPIVITQEGGYEINSIADIVSNFVSQFTKY